MREYKGSGEWNKEFLRELQLKELEILIYFSDFCREHKLRFYLAGGTLLGAVRHKGFIPWDDDVDVHMPRPDYEALPELWEEYALKDKYALGITTLEHNYRHHAYAVIDQDTTLITKRNVDDDIAQGVKIDVIPLDGAPKGKIAQTTQLIWATLFAIYNVQRLPENQGGKAMKFGVRVALNLIKDPAKRFKIWKIAERHMSKENFDSSSCVKELVASFRTMKCLYPRENFTEIEWLDFEGHKFPAHHYYKLYLTNVYNDYMKLPPEDKRNPKGDYVYINLDEGYEKYKGKYYCIGSL